MVVDATSIPDEYLSDLYDPDSGRYPRVGEYLFSLRHRVVGKVLAVVYDLHGNPIEFKISARWSPTMRVDQRSVFISVESMDELIEHQPRRYVTW